MKKPALENFFSTFYDDSGKLRLPASRDERQRLAGGLISFVGVRAFEGAFDRVREKLSNRRSKQPAGNPASDAGGKEAALRETLSTLSQTQKHAVLQLVRDELYLLIFSLFGSLDEFDFGWLSIGLRLARSLKEDDDEDDDLDDRPADVTIVPHRAELHSKWVSWAHEFSSVMKLHGQALWGAEL